MAEANFIKEIWANVRRETYSKAKRRIGYLRKNVRFVDDEYVERRRNNLLCLGLDPESPRDWSIDDEVLNLRIQRMTSEGLLGHPDGSYGDILAARNQRDLVHLLQELRMNLSNQE